MKKVIFWLILCAVIITAAILIFPGLFTKGGKPGDVEPVNNETKLSGGNITGETAPENEAAGTKAPESTTGGSTSKPMQNQALGLPARILTGYWHNFDNGAKCLTIKDVPASYSLIAVAFAEATTNPGEVTFALDDGLCKKLGGYTKEQFIEDIAFAKTKGQRVIISVGGERGAVSVSDDAAAERFAESAYKIITEYGFDGIDIDLENGLQPEAMEKALRSLYEKLDGNCIITMAPQTIDMQSPQNGYFKLALNIKDILTIVNMQYYNSGSMAGQDGGIYSQGSIEFLTALAAIQLENGLRPDQVGLGLPSCGSAAGGGYVEPSVVAEAIKSLANGTKAGSYTPPRAYPEIRGAMTWSINWDASNGYAFANRVAGELLSLPEVSATAPPETKAPENKDPEITTSKAETHAPSGTEWKQGTSYSAGDKVTYGGKTYRCIQPHSALIGWEPDKSPALWEAV